MLTLTLTAAVAPLAGTADCELRDDWFLEQDVNAWSSLAYVGAGAFVLVGVARGRLSAAYGALGAVVVVEGVGSVLYHGSRGEVAQLLHDAPLVGMLGFLAGWHVGRVTDRAGRFAVVGLAASSAGATVAWAAESGIVNGAVALLVIVVTAAEVLARRRGLPPVWGRVLLALGALAAAAWLAGTPDSPLCEEASWAQPHGGWHVLTALLVVGWVRRAVATEHADHATSGAR